MRSLIASLLLGHDQVMLHEQVNDYAIPVSDETLKLRPIN